MLPDRFCSDFSGWARDYLWSGLKTKCALCPLINFCNHLKYLTRQGFPGLLNVKHLIMHPISGKTLALPTDFTTHCTHITVLHLPCLHTLHCLRLPILTSHTLHLHTAPTYHILHVLHTSHAHTHTNTHTHTHHTHIHTATIRGTTETVRSCH